MMKHPLLRHSIRRDLQGNLGFFGWCVSKPGSRLVSERMVQQIWRRMSYIRIDPSLSHHSHRNCRRNQQIQFDSIFHFFLVRIYHQAHSETIWGNKVDQTESHQTLDWAISQSELHEQLASDWRQGTQLSTWWTTMSYRMCLVSGFYSFLQFLQFEVDFDNSKDSCERSGWNTS